MALIGNIISSAKDRAGELTNDTIGKMLKGVDMTGLQAKINEYQQKTGRDASKLADFIANLKPSKTDIVAFAQKVPVAEILDIAEDVTKTIPAAGVPIKIVIKILRLLLKVKK